MKELIKKSLLPAEVSDIKIDTENHEATVYMLNEEKIKAIGKWWANINLATELTWYRISIISNDEVN